MSSSEGDLWYVKLANGDVHRATLDQIQEAFEGGQIDASTLVLGADETTWKTLGELAGLGDEPAPVPQEIAEFAPAPAVSAEEATASASPEASPEVSVAPVIAAAPEAVPQEMVATPAAAPRPAAPESIATAAPVHAPAPAAAPAPQAAPSYAPAPAHAAAVHAAPAAPVGHPSYAPVAPAPVTYAAYAPVAAAGHPSYAPVAPVAPPSYAPVAPAGHPSYAPAARAVQPQYAPVPQAGYPSYAPAAPPRAPLPMTPTPPIATTFVPQPSTLRPMSMDFSDDDLASLRGGSRKRWGVVAGAAVAVAAIAGVALSRPAIRDAAFGNSSDSTAAIAAPARAPAPLPEPAPAPPPPPSPQMAAIDSPANDSPLTPRFTDQTRQKLLDADKQRDEKNKTRSRSVAGTSGHGSSHAKSSGFTTDGNKFDPLNSSI
jgi:hypothetical protein